MTDKLKALATYLECDLDEVDKCSYGENHFDGPGGEYLVCTDDEADEECAEYIKQSLWAFNASFLSGFTGLPEEVFTALQDKCEGANDTFEQLINDVDGFIEEAIGADGRGHFLSGYDGCENSQDEFFIYRTN